MTREEGKQRRKSNWGVTQSAGGFMRERCVNANEGWRRLKIWTSVRNTIDSTQEEANREREKAQRESKKRETGSPTVKKQSI
jgi:hypothetical protein